LDIFTVEVYEEEEEEEMPLYTPEELAELVSAR
jgi:hypothetical protein